jgi:hypothetical protein
MFPGGQHLDAGVSVQLWRQELKLRMHLLT